MAEFSRQGAFHDYSYNLNNCYRGLATVSNRQPKFLRNDYELALRRISKNVVSGFDEYNIAI